MFSFINIQETPNKKRIFFLILMALLLISGAMLFNGPNQSQTIVVEFPSGTKLETQVADTPEKLLFGLAFQEFLPDNEGLLFIYDSSAPHKVWTKGFRFPVDVIWVDESKHIVHLVKDAPPCEKDPCPWYGPPPNNARYIIETNQGFIKQKGVSMGDQLTFALRM